MHTLIGDRFWHECSLVAARPCCSLIFLISVVLPWTPEPPLPCRTHSVPVCISGPGRVGVTALLIAPRGDLLGGWRSLASHTANPQQHTNVSQPVTKREYLKVWNTCIVCISHTPLFQVHVSDILVFPCYLSVISGRKHNIMIIASKIIVECYKDDIIFAGQNDYFSTSSSIVPKPLGFLNGFLK